MSYDFNSFINNFFQGKINDEVERHSNVVSLIMTEQKISLFIIQDICNGCLHCLKKDNQMIYRFKDILKLNNITNLPFTTEWNIISVMRGFNIKIKKDSKAELIIVELPPDLVDF
ncbi:MAG: hypothetical protein PHE32_03660 [Candidatus Shapirobacteria bacterium]|nr:hypothetical protein [Candidatus Shapirobacteria bacterium]MDD4410771.1 hypothetical protein [Candidatus Shapirobacteria bacterium]